MVVILGSSVLLGAVEVRGLLGISLSASGSHGVGLLQSLTFTFQVCYMTNTGVHVLSLSLAHTQMGFLLCFVFNCYRRQSEDRNTPKEAGPAPKHACN